MAKVMEKEKTKTIDVQAMIDDLAEKANAALKEMESFDQEKVDHIVHEMAMTALDQHMPLAKMAVEETGRGVYEDKAIKNMYASEYIWHNIKHDKTVGVINEDVQKGLIEIAEPVGVVCGVTPTTNPTSTTIFKSMIALKTRNPIVFAFHPSAQKSSADGVFTKIRQAFIRRPNLTCNSSFSEWITAVCPNPPRFNIPSHKSNAWSVLLALIMARTGESFSLESG